MHVQHVAFDESNGLHLWPPIIAPRVQSGEVKVVAAYYSLDTGQGELLK